MELDEPAVVDAVFWVLMLLELWLLKSLPMGVPGSDRSMFVGASTPSKFGASLIIPCNANKINTMKLAFC